MANVHLAAMSEIALQSALVCLGGRPNFLSKPGSVRATKPRAPTSMVNVDADQPLSLALQFKSKYLACFRTCADSIPSSAGHVSSMFSTDLILFDQMTMSGLWDVA